MNLSKKLRNKMRTIKNHGPDTGHISHSQKRGKQEHRNSEKAGNVVEMFRNGL